MGGRGATAAKVSSCIESGGGGGGASALRCLRVTACDARRHGHSPPRGTRAGARIDNANKPPK